MTHTELLTLAAAALFPTRRIGKHEVNLFAERSVERAELIYQKACRKTLSSDFDPGKALDAEEREKVLTGLAWSGDPNDPDRKLSLYEPDEGVEAPEGDS